MGFKTNIAVENLDELLDNVMLKEGCGVCSSVLTQLKKEVKKEMKKQGWT